MTLAIVAAVGIALGLTLVVAGATSTIDPDAPTPARTPRRRALLGPLDRRNALIGLTVGVVLAFLGWIVAILVAPVIAVLVPKLVRREDGVDPDDLEALEEWTRALSSVIGAGQGLATAIEATRSSCPDRIRPQVERLIARIYAQQPLKQALYGFATDIDNQVGDIVAASLIQASQHEGAALRKALDGIAADIADEVRARRDIEASRAGARSQSRIITIVAVVALTGFVFATPLGAQYRSGPGQALLLVIVALFLGCLYWLKRAATTEAPARVLVAPQEKP